MSVLTRWRNVQLLVPHTDSGRNSRLPCAGRGDRRSLRESWGVAGCFFLQAEDGIRDVAVTGVQTCALPILGFQPAPSMLELFERAENPEDPFELRDLYLGRVEAHMGAIGTRADLAVRWKAATKKDRKSTRLNSSHGYISYAVFCLKKKTRRNSGPAGLSHPDRLHWLSRARDAPPWGGATPV